MKTYITFISLLLLLLSCSSKYDGDEVFRALSPAGNAEAILIETNGGATTSYGYIVYLKSTANKNSKIEVANFYGAVRSNSAYGVNIKWLSGTELQIEYLEAKSAKILTPSIELENINYKVTLKSGIEDVSAPSGGMFYSLQGRPSD